MAIITVAEADAYFAGSFKAEKWGALGDEEKTIALNEASRWLNALCWHGTKCDEEQADSWPRDVAEDAAGCGCDAAVCPDIPAVIVQATAELALSLQQSQGAVESGPTGEVQSQSLGELSQSYFQSRGRKVSTSAPLVLQVYPWLVDLLGCYLQGSYGGSRVLSRC